MLVQGYLHDTLGGWGEHDHYVEAGEERKMCLRFWGVPWIVVFEPVLGWKWVLTCSLGLDFFCLG